ncbi:DUF1257 domain-containing protein [candidate division KSB3 bacterium]|uniref:DUF1257 domain-containing protein n=1 Tax=candidate division KSB3 bacterium TaxID=2044937 RepID=A0A9D5JTG0_9BACT|nr:DUF1257 domain-containing protein [candidate division KSB3 bacterium]MBD3323870.1 DUF1257 domain-containing protein [candidate division KSB3 bacterium]
MEPMSRIVSIHTELRDREVLQECLEHLNCQVLFQEGGIKMRGAETPVQLLVHAPFGSFGFRQTPAGTYELVGDDRILSRQQGFLQRLKQQYAYRKVLKDANAAGYNLVHEEIGPDQTIKLVIRKW